jgi:hypothetical protein
MMDLFDKGQPLSGQVGIFSRTRPLRIAFVLEDDAKAHENLDAIFSYAYRRWGGKRFLIVPANSGAISEQYWNWLTVYDPDVVYSYCSLSDVLTKKIGHVICPFQISEHGRRAPISRPHPEIHVDGLSSFSVLPYLLARSQPGDQRPIRILGFYDYRNRDPFIADSFGGDLPLNPSLSPAMAKLLLKPLAIVSQSEPRHSPSVEDQVVDSATILSRMTAEPTLTLAQLSGARVPDEDFGFQRWSMGLNIVVGDSFVDRVCFWNGRLLVRPSDDRGFSALRIPRARLQEPTFIEALCRFIDKIAWQIPGGFSGRPTIFLRSHSVPIQELTNLVEELRRIARCPVPAPEEIPGIDACCPTEESLSRSRRYFREEHRQYVSNTRAYAEMVSPTHLEDVDPSDVAFLSGSWMVEHKIERHGDLSVAINRAHWW